jgi:hypothetical protein
MYLIKVGRRYFSARRGYFGGLTNRSEATRFSLQDATELASLIVGAIVTEAL